MPPPHPPEFPRRAVELARQVDEHGNRVHPIGPLVPRPEDLRVVSADWLAQADVDDGHRNGLSTSERKELVELRRENRVLRMERDLLSRAAAFFAQENVLPR